MDQGLIGGNCLGVDALGLWNLNKQISSADAGSTDDMANAECQWIDSDEYDISSPRQSTERMSPKLQNNITVESEENDVFFDSS